MLNVELYDVKGQLGGWAEGVIYMISIEGKDGIETHEGEGDGDLPCFEASGVTSCTSNPGCRQRGLQNTSVYANHETTDGYIINPSVIFVTVLSPMSKLYRK